MTTLFGQRIEPDFDLAKEKRRNRLGWALILGLPLCVLYDILGFHFATQVFQGWLATVLSYGVTFYINQRSNIGTRWLWKAVLASLPVHALYLLGVFWSDSAFPGLMMKVIVFVPALAVLSAIESLFFFDRIVGWFKPRDADRSSAPPAEK